MTAASAARIDVAAFVDMYRHHLRGRPVAAPAADSPLLAVVVHRQGWRPDGWARARNLLAGALDCYAEEGKFSPLGRDRALVAETIRALWGVSGHPAGAEAVRARLELAVGERTVQTWHSQVLQDPAVRTFLSSKTAALPAPARRPPAQRTAWTERAEQWPPPLWNGVAERAQLLVAARRALERPELDDDEILRALRELTEPRLRAWFAGADRSGYAIYAENMVFGPWFSRDPLASVAPSIRPEPTRSGATYSPAVSAASQMLMWSTLDDPSALQKAVDDRAAAVQRLSMFTSSLATSSSLITAAAESLDLADARSRIAALFRSGGVPATYMAGTRPLDPRAALQAAYRIRAEADPAAKLLLIEEYVRARSTAKDRGSGATAHALIALADQSVHWDCVVAEDPGLVERFAGTVLDDPAPARLELGAHAHRCRAVVANKNDRWGAALGHVGAGLEHLAVLDRWRLAEDPFDMEAAGHQLWLAGAGISVRHLERILIRAGRREFSDYVTQHARLALWFAGAAWDALTFLDRDGQLPGVRHERGHIASIAWRAQTRIIRLRVLLAVRTAMEACLVPDHLGRVGHDGPAVALGPAEPRPTDLGASEIPTLVALYRELLVLPQITAAHTLDLVLLGSWLAMLNHGRLPVVQDPVLAAVQPACQLLGGDPDAIANGVNSIPLDVGTLTQWLAERDCDARVLSHIRRRGPVWRALDRSSCGLYTDFRDRHGPGLFSTVSHD